MARNLQRLFLGFAGLYGLAGVALSAAAAHAPGDTHLLASISTMCLAHAPALLALQSYTARIRTAAAGGCLILLGTLLFSLDLLSLYGRSHGLFPFAAPIGGFMMMGGWLLIGLGAVFPSREAA